MYFAKFLNALENFPVYIRGLLYRDSTVCNFALLRGKGKKKGKAASIEAEVITHVKNA